MSPSVTRIYGGRQISSVIQIILQHSCAFNVTPLPDERWEVAVKPDAARHLPDSSALPEPILSVADLLSLGYEIKSDDARPFCFYWRNSEGRSEVSFTTAEFAHDDAIESVLEAHTLSRCDDCGKVLKDEDLAPVKKLSMRVAPGGLVPSGECTCGALAYPVSV